MNETYTLTALQAPGASGPGWKELLGEAILKVAWEKHPLEDLFEASDLIPLLGNGTVRSDFWRRRVFSVCAVVLVPELSALSERRESTCVDKLGLFQWCRNDEELVDSLTLAGIESEAVADVLSNSRRLLRQGHQGHSLIFLAAEAIARVCDDHDLNLGDVLRLVLWHEVGHAVFNPFLSFQTLPPAMQPPSFCKAYQFLIEGAAEWFAWRAEDWASPLRRHLFNDNPNDTVDPYSYLTVLLALENRPNALARILLPFAGAAPHTALKLLPVVGGQGPQWKLDPQDFGPGNCRGMDVQRLEGFASAWLRTAQTRITRRAAHGLWSWFRELIDDDVACFEIEAFHPHAPAPEGPGGWDDFGLPLLGPAEAPILSWRVTRTSSDTWTLQAIDRVVVATSEAEARFVWYDWDGSAWKKTIDSVAPEWAEAVLRRTLWAN